MHVPDIELFTSPGLRVCHLVGTEEERRSAPPHLYARGGADAEQ